MKYFSKILVVCFALLVSSCIENVLVDTNTAVANRNWSYFNKVRVPVTVENAEAKYNIYINLRHTADYKYSNLFLLIHQTNPDGKTTTVRKEYQLAYADGEWLGSGSGNLFSYQLIFKKGYKFPAKGTYSFEIEENMRDNPLREISDVGLRVEPAK